MSLKETLAPVLLGLTLGFGPTARAEPLHNQQEATRREIRFTWAFDFSNAVREAEAKEDQKTIAELQNLSAIAIASMLGEDSPTDWDMAWYESEESIGKICMTTRQSDATAFVYGFDIVSLEDSLRYTAQVRIILDPLNAVTYKPEGASVEELFFSIHQVFEDFNEHPYPITLYSQSPHD